MDTLTHAPSGTQWTIEAAGQRAVVVEVGGGLRKYEVNGVDVLFGYEVDEVCPASAGKVLAPWPNRIRDGRYSFAGDVHQLALTEPSRHNAIHGLVNWVRWSRVSGDDSSITVEYEVVPQPGYRWPLALRTTWSLNADGLTAEHSATNTGTEPCPFGLATHPYVQVPGLKADELLLGVPGRLRLLVDSRMLPIGAAKVAGEYDFTEPRAIGGLALDTAYGDLIRDADGRSTVTLTAPDGRGVRVWADSAFNWWQVFTGDTLAAARYRRAVAVEPMTCPPDAFRSGRDLIVIQPGETWRGSWGMRAV
ncbi:aldose 1-epimerase family protein [Planosporangium flavigriseum]|uniref:Aldose 1-epimerase n=1 Tax=Planosporangium flavigriseum TaxID=373681 RepID=A0A8J3PNW0_9ACTN|nr:aldose 1-epimerase family protein [Planosporangium flavigriseum]NJC66860.1 aldose 1-epimerase family protein [Planosporangium flavigriseum]GIG74396.1 aldose 1-epimerase [Planosporangium flavigriseum]